MRLAFCFNASNSRDKELCPKCCTAWERLCDEPPSKNTSKSHANNFPLLSLKNSAEIKQIISTCRLSDQRTPNAKMALTNAPHFFGKYWTERAVRYKKSICAPNKTTFALNAKQEVGGVVSHYRIFCDPTSIRLQKVHSFLLYILNPNWKTTIG